MSARARHAVWLVALLPALALGAWAVREHYAPGPEGRYASSGEMLLESGERVAVAHRIELRDGRFHAMTRHGDAVLEKHGRVQYGRSTVHLMVEAGEVRGLDAKLDDDTVFNLLHGRSAGAHIVLEAFDDCLIARYSRELYCPVGR